MPEPEFVIYNGERMVAGWPQRIEEAQTIAFVSINGRKYPRIPYGDEPDNRVAAQKPCRDCGVIKAQFHVIDCDVERCPCCGRQSITCDCVYDTDEKK
jgi:hypothetical protein